MDILVSKFPRRKDLEDTFSQPANREEPIVIGNWEMGDRFGFNSMPATLLIDRNGKIADLHVGMVDKDPFESEIQILLNESASNKAAK